MTNSTNFGNGQYRCVIGLNIEVGRKIGMSKRDVIAAIQIVVTEHLQRIRTVLSSRPWVEKGTGLKIKMNCAQRTRWIQRLKLAPSLTNLPVAIDCVLACFYVSEGGVDLCISQCFTGTSEPFFFNSITFGNTPQQLIRLRSAVGFFARQLDEHKQSPCART